MKRKGDLSAGLQCEKAGGYGDTDAMCNKNIYSFWWKRPFGIVVYKDELFTNYLFGAGFKAEALFLRMNTESDYGMSRECEY